jgi:hypothetical protein
VPLSLFRSRSLLSVLGAALLVCAASLSAQTTTITGKVYSPYGPTLGDPIPNILVYVAQSPVLPFTQQGVVQGKPCSQQPLLVSGNPLVATNTDASGSFTLTSNSMPNPATIVIQAGKWRRQYVNVPVTIGGTNPPLQLTLPGSSTHNQLVNGTIDDLPHIAIVTGQVDAVECIFHQIGILDTEFTNPDGTGSINLYTGAVNPGAINPGSTPADPTPGESTLVSSESTLAQYDLVMFGCQGTPTQPIATQSPYPNANQTNLIDYANSGGRIFATHYEYVWLDTDQPFESTATWRSNSGIATGTGIATIDQSYPEGLTLAHWIQNVGASYNNTLGQIQLQNTDVNTVPISNTVPVNNPPAQSWVNLNNTTYDNPSMQFTFDTPVGAPGVPTVAVTFSNSSADFLQGDTADTVTMNVTNNSSAAADPSLTLSIALPAGLTPTSLMGVGNTGWTCDLTALTCNRQISGQPLAAGATDSILLTFNIALNATVGQASLTASLTGGGISGTGQCGRVLYNDYHVENTSVVKNTIYPAECTNLPGTAAGTATAQEKFLEFSLYNLSNFIAPSTTDVLVIHGLSTLNWPQPAAIPYGTALSATQLDATASDVDSGVSLPGTFVYSPAAGTVPGATSVTVSVNFTPTDSTDYSTASDTVNIAVTPDATTTTLTKPVKTIFYGQVIALTAVEGVSSNGPATTLDGGMLNFLIDGVVTCSFLEPSSATACPPSTGAGYDARPAQPYMTQSVYTGDTNFAPSQSAVYPVTVLPATTATTVALSATSVMVGTAVTFTSAVANTVDSAAPVGTVTFLDNTATIGTAAVSAQGTAGLTLSNLAVGPHSIMACYAAPANNSGSVNFAPSCSAFKSLVVTLPPSMDSTQTLLTSNVNPSYFGQAVTFTSNVSTTGAFVAIPQGTVTFYDGATAIGTGTLDSTGTASLTTSTLAIGSHTMTASFGPPLTIVTGSVTFSPSVSAPYTQVVNSPLASAGNGFILQVTPTTVTVPVGGSVSVAVTVIELNNFQQPVQLSCTGLPAEGTCNFAQSLIPETGGSTQLAISATAPHDCGSSSPYFVAGGRGTALLWLGVTALGLFFARKRRLLQSLAVAAVLLLLPTLQGCGTGNCTDFGLKPGTYTFTVQGTANGSSCGKLCVTTANGQVIRTVPVTMNVTVQ